MIKVSEAYICLLPKKIDSREVGDSRPISLTTGLYKILARVLSEQLKWGPSYYKF